MGLLVLSDASRTLAGILLVSFVAIEIGGVYLVRVTSGRVELTEFQRSFARAGHAHAGVLVMLALVCQLYVDAIDQSGVIGWLSRSGVAIAAIAMPAGFFFSSMGAARVKPNRLVALVFAGAVLFGAGVLSLGVGLLRSD